MKTLWMPRALRDLTDIRQYIARSDALAARQWTAQLFSRGNAIATLPLAGRKVPELDEPDTREVFLRSYRIVYRALPDAIEIVTVFDGRRLFPFDAIDDAGDDAL